MRRSIMTAAVAVALGTALGTVGPAAAQEGPGKDSARDITLTADVVDLSCRLVHGLSGEDHRMCAQVCADKGIPLALFANGEVLMPVSMGMPGVGSNDQLRPFAEQRVTVKGKLIERGGLKAIVIESIERA